ncbi:PEP-CTERM sorting domain-containing protein [Methylophilus sp. 'Pure River']|jgi:hypothetical protein|uniref:PEP-CTERM sorting domain-containing protein n=1 Tax=Methylophilus sp. 'Pure River' TaxID=3377117 RepID=UPI00398F21C5
MRGIFNKLAVSIAFAFSLSNQAVAANTTVELQTIDQGFYSGITASHNPLNPSIGIDQVSGSADRNFFVFDFTGLDMSALVSIQLFANNVWNSSPENNIEYSLFDVSASIADLRNGGSGQYSIYNDLGSGVEYASLQISNPGRYDSFAIQFNQAGIDAAKSTNGFFAIGGALTSSTSGVTWMWADNQNANAPLSYGLRLSFSENISPVPEADSYAMFLAGLGLMGLMSRRRTK